jgi:hypothetical protein
LKAGAGQLVSCRICSARAIGGYTFKTEEGKAAMIAPLWAPELPAFDGRLELGFRDLIELRFVNAFLQAGLRLNTIRKCLDYARECVNDPRPFSTR